MGGHGGSSASSYLAGLTSPIPSHCASIVATSTLRVNIYKLHLLWSEHPSSIIYLNLPFSLASRINTPFLELHGTQWFDHCSNVLPLWMKQSWCISCKCSELVIIIHTQTTIALCYFPIKVQVITTSHISIPQTPMHPTIHYYHLLYMWTGRPCRHNCIPKTAL